MAATIEQIYAGLFSLASTVTWGTGLTWIKSERRIRLFSDVDKDQQPWLGQAEHDAEYAQVSSLPYKRTFPAEWVIYVATNEDDPAPTTQLNTILQAIEDALAPKVNDIGYPKRNTLGGLVYHCYIDGKLLKDPGDIDNQGMMIVPIRILAP